MPDEAVQRPRPAVPGPRGPGAEIATLVVMLQLDNR